jgi:hypothetical protein
MALRHHENISVVEDSIHLTSVCHDKVKVQNTPHHPCGQLEGTYLPVISSNIRTCLSIKYYVIPKKRLQFSSRCPTRSNLFSCDVQQ